MVRDSSLPSIGDTVSVLGLQANIVMKMNIPMYGCKASKGQSHTDQAFCTQPDTCVLRGGPVFWGQVLAGWMSQCDIADQAAVYARMSALVDFVESGIVPFRVSFSAQAASNNRLVLVLASAVVAYLCEFCMSFVCISSLWKCSHAEMRTKRREAAIDALCNSGVVG
jgi:hypothetical protein